MGKGAHDRTHWIQAIWSPERESPAEPKVKGGLEQNFSTSMPTHTAHWGASNGPEAHFKINRTLSQALPALHQPLQVRAVYLFVRMPYTFLM